MSLTVQDLESSQTTGHDRHFRQHEQVVDFHRIDVIGFNSTVTEAPAIGESVERIASQGRMGSHHAAALLFDTFNTLNKNNPKRTDQGEPIAREIITRIVESPGYADLRNYTVGDDLASGLGSISLAETVATQMSEDLKQKAKDEREAREAAQEAAAYADALGEDADTDPDAQAQANDAANEAATKAQQQAERLGRAIKDNAASLTRVVQAAVGKATDDASALHDAGEVFGGLNPGSGNSDPLGGMPIAEKFKLAKMVQRGGKGFRNLLKLIGRMTSEAIAKKSTKMHHDAGEVVDLDIGNDLEALIEDEVAALVVPQLKTLALGRFADESMAQYRVEAKETLARGDMVVMVDESGSMSCNAVTHDGEPVTREAQSKAIAIALVHAAVREGRSAHVLFFQETVTATFSITPKDAKTTDSSGLNVAASKLAQIAQRGTAGGTKFNDVLTQSQNLIETGRADRADMVLITDGIANVSPKVNERLNTARAKDGLHVYTLLLGGEAGGARDVVTKFSDKVWNADNLLKGAASELFELT